MEVARRAQASAHGRRLFVSGVASEVKKTDLQREFGEFGHVTDIELPLTAKGVAFVEFDNARDAADALEEVTGRKLKGMVLKVKMADIQKTTPGPAAAALAQDRLTGMVRPDGLHDRTGPAVVQTANQEREDRRTAPRPWDGGRTHGRRSHSAKRSSRARGKSRSSGRRGSPGRDRGKSRSRSRGRRRSGSQGRCCGKSPVRSRRSKTRSRTRSRGRGRGSSRRRQASHGKSRGRTRSGSRARHCTGSPRRAPSRGGGSTRTGSQNESSHSSS